MTVTKKMIYIDNWIKEGMAEEEYNLIFSYLKDIVMAISCKKGWFKGKELVDFGSDTAGVILMRVLRPELYKKRKSDPNEKPKPVTQIKNYLDICLLGLSIKWRQENYMTTPKNEDKYELTDLDKKKKYSEYYPTFNWAESELNIIFKDVIQSMPKLVKEYVKRNNNFYNEDLLYVNIMINLINIFSNLKTNKEIEVKRIVLYGLSKEENDKITFLVRGMIRQILNEFQELFGDSQLTLENFYQAVSNDYIGETNETKENQF